MPEFGIVVPVRNEAQRLRHTVPALLAEIADAEGHLVYVCNDCADGSADLVREMAGSSATVIETPTPGKTGALQLGDEALGAVFPRFYIDADVTLARGTIHAMCQVLQEGQADLVAVRRVHLTQDVTAVSAHIARTWDALPFARQAGFLGAIGLSASGRAAWDRWPDVMGDDIFVAASVPADRRMILPGFTASTSPPSDFRGWVRMRARWRRGEVQLRAMGLDPPRAEGQRAALLRRMLNPSQALGAWAFVAARLLVPLVRMTPGNNWLPDRSNARPRA